MASRTRSISYGKCFLCGKTFAKNTISRHLKKCLSEHEPAGGKAENLFHLRAEGRYAPDYWLHLEIPASATLVSLDDFLRDVWLECCGHLSAFAIGHVRYEMDTGMVDAMWRDIFGSLEPTRNMNVKLSRVLSAGQTFLHEYDFGTTTELSLKVIDTRQGSRPPQGVRILARNYVPAISCTKCDKPAEWINTYEDFEPYCKTHARKHKDWREGFLPVVNSPRVGDCGYCGPSDKALMFEESAPPRP